MACPECGSKRVVNENTGRDPFLKRIGGDFHNTCRNCGCQWTSYGIGGYLITVHGRFKKKKGPEFYISPKDRRRLKRLSKQKP